MPSSILNRRCVCGHTRFHNRHRLVEEEVARWMLFDSTELSGGFGATPFGTYFGAEGELGGGEWGLFTGTYRSADRETVCAGCSRVRSTRRLGGITPLGIYVSNNVLYVVAADVDPPVTCFSVRFTSGLYSYESMLELSSGVPLAVLAETPANTAVAPPTGAAVADVLLEAAIPEVEFSGSYLVTLIDRCSNRTVSLATVTLETEPMILVHQQADLGGAPSLWLQGSRVEPPTLQLASGSRQSIPFDKCDAVLEYDARFGSLPADQGWTHAGAGSDGDYQLLAGGSCQLQSTVALPSYWTKTVALSAAPGSAYAYTKFLDRDTTAGVAAGDGYEVEARYAVALATPYAGVRLNHYSGISHATALDGGSDSAVGTLGVGSWAGLAAGGSASGPEGVWAGSGVSGISIFGTDGSAGALELVGQFGDAAGTGIDVIVQNVVISTPGRFIRPWFTAFAPVASPKVRLYFVRDAAAGDTKARFLIRYGQATATPYAFPGLTVEQTINLVLPDTVYEMALDLPGLVASQPFWFTVERDWSHGDDVLQSTVHLLQTSVRSV